MDLHWFRQDPFLGLHFQARSHFQEAAQPTSHLEAGSWHIGPCKRDDQNHVIVIFVIVFCFLNSLHNFTDALVYLHKLIFVDPSPSG